MKKIVVIDSETKKDKWESISEYIIFSQNPSDENPDAFIISQDFLGASLPETMKEIKKIPVPVAVITSDGSIENQEYLCSIGADEIICRPVCHKMLMRKISSLVTSVPSLVNGQLIDFSVFNAIEAGNGGLGAYTVSSGDFAGIYRFILRLLERLEKNAQLLIMTLDSENPENCNNVMNILSKAVQICLRRGDISSVFGNNQVIILLMGADGDGGHLVANRIISNFYSECDNDSYRLNYDIRDIKPR